MAPELVEAALKTVATIERLASSLPPSSAGAASFYAPPQPLPPVPGDKYTWDVITEEQGVKARGATRRGAQHASPHAGTQARAFPPLREPAAAADVAHGAPHAGVRAAQRRRAAARGGRGALPAVG